MSDKLKIGITVDAFYPMWDGVVEVVDKYARGLCDVADITVFTVDGGDFDDSSLPYKVVRCKSSKVPFTQYRLPRPKRDKEFMRRLAAADLDVMHINSPFSVGAAAAGFAKKNSIPVVATFHSQYKRDFLKHTHSRLISAAVLKTLMKTFNKADLVLTMNDFAAKLFESYGGRSPVRILPNAPCATPIAPRETYAAEGAEFYGDGARLLFVGRLISDKGIFEILEALRILDARGMKFSMLYVGSGYLSKKLAKKIARYKLGGKVRLLGRITDKKTLLSLYAAADLFMFPSVYDTDGVVKKEAAAVGTPSLVARGTGAASEITDGENGFVADCDPRAIADRTERIFADPAALVRVGEKAREDLCVSWEEVNGRLLQIYASMAEKRPQSR